MKQFDHLISPLPRERFFQEYFEKKHLHLKGNDLNKFDQYLRESDIDHILMSQKLTLPNARMAHKDADLEADDLVIKGTKTIDVSRVIEKFSEGATLILSQLQEKSSLKILCNDLSKDFGQRFQTNIYYTPKNGRQGFKIHHDTHDVFILQIAGSKKWSIYESPIQLAIKDQEFKPDTHIPGKLIDEFTMNQGDMLYIPRGLMHAAKTTDQKSIHITTGFMGITWQDILINHINGLCQENEILRRGLKPNYWNNFDEYSESFSQIMEMINDQSILKDGLTNFHKRNANRLPTFFKNPIKNAEEIENISLKHALYLRESLQFHYQETDENIELITLNKEITLPIDYKPILDFILAEKSFIVNDLPLLDDDSKIEFTQMLIKSGILEINFEELALS